MIGTTSPRVRGATRQGYWDYPDGSDEEATEALTSDTAGGCVSGACLHRAGAQT